ncbi:response regulator [Candidatus Omnitrophota bacterium]
MFEKILIAEDDVDIRIRLYELFSQVGYKVTCVPDGKEALLRLIEDRPDLVILDMDMPELDGIETAKRIRNFDKDIKIILTSKKDGIGNDKAVGDLNIYTIVKKDFSSPVMIQQIRSILRENKACGLKKCLLEKSKGSILILIVDDNREIRDVLGSFLSKKGYKVLQASSGEEALMKIKAEVEKPQFVLLDMRMPGMDGLGTLREVKNLDDSIKVAMLTSAQEEHIMQEAMKLGADDYIIKPCDLNKLDTLITSILFREKE